MSDLTKPHWPYGAQKNSRTGKITRAPYRASNALDAAVDYNQSVRARINAERDGSERLTTNPKKLRRLIRQAAKNGSILPPLKD